jgi:flagellar hook-length control protein FliK
VANYPKGVQQGTAAAPAAALPPEVRFAETNHAQIVSGIKGDLLPNGGTMQLRLDPGHLGPLEVTVKVVDGVVSASFQTSNEEATRLLSHSLGQLKQVLESGGINVDRLQVQQAPPAKESGQASTNSDGQRQPQGQTGQGGLEERSARQEQQRREMIEKMWEKIARGRGPVDVKA